MIRLALSLSLSLFDVHRDRKRTLEIEASCPQRGGNNIRKEVHATDVQML